MNINCIICSDLFSQSDEIYSTPCGHIFHHTCLLQWIERSSTCPQCRKKTTERNMCKIYFNILNTEGITQDAGSLQVKLDNTEFQLRQKSKQVKELEGDVIKMKKLCEQSDETILNIKGKLKTKEIAIADLQEKVEYLKVENSEITMLRNTNDKLQNQVELMKGLEEVIYGTTAEVESMVNNTPDVSKLATYTVVLKRAVMESEIKKKAARDNLQMARNQISKLKMENEDLHAKLVALEATVNHSDAEIAQLKNRLAGWEKMKDCAKRKLDDVIDSSVSEEMSNKRISQQIHGFDFMNQTAPSTSRNLMKENTISLTDSNSPYLNVKQCANPMAVYLKKKSLSTPLASNPKSSEFSIFRANRLSTKLKTDVDIIMKKSIDKKSIDNQSTVNYDGFGGHSKLDVFPVPKKLDSVPKKTSAKSVMSRVERPSNQKTINSILKPSMLLNNKPFLSNPSSPKHLKTPSVKVTGTNVLAAKHKGKMSLSPNVSKKKAPSPISPHSFSLNSKLSSHIKPSKSIRSPSLSPRN